MAQTSVSSSTLDVSSEWYINRDSFQYSVASAAVSTSAAPLEAASNSSSSSSILSASSIVEASSSSATNINLPNYNLPLFYGFTPLSTIDTHGSLFLKDLKQAPFKLLKMNQQEGSVNVVWSKAGNQFRPLEEDPPNSSSTPVQADAKTSSSEVTGNGVWLSTPEDPIELLNNKVNTLKSNRDLEVNALHNAIPEPQQRLLAFCLNAQQIDDSNVFEIPNGSPVSVPAIPSEVMPILVYGFASSSTSNPRARVIEYLENNSINRITQKELNDNLGFSRLNTNFKNYKAFMRDEIIPVTTVLDSASSAWKDFLLENRSHFDFREAVKKEKGRKRFFLKNFSIDLLHLFFRNKKITKKLGDDISNFANMNSSDLLPGWVNNIFDSFEEIKLPEESPASNSYELDDDQKVIRDQLIQIAFFRKVSKLGLRFAKEYGYAVLFTWHGPNIGQQPPELNKLITNRPYQGSSFRSFSRDDIINKYTKEPITFSEMRKLKRLVDEHQEPFYLLVRLPPNSSTTSPASNL